MNTGGITNIDCENNFIFKVIRIWLYGPNGSLTLRYNLGSPKGFCHLTHVAYLADSTKVGGTRKKRGHTKFSQPFMVLTVAARQGVAPLVIFLANNWLLITQRVARVARERHSGAGGEAAATAAAVDRDTRIEARVWLHFHTCESERESQLTNDCHIYIFMAIQPTSTGLTFISNTEACRRTAVVGGKQQEEHVGGGNEEMRGLGTVVFTNQGRRCRGTIPDFQSVIVDLSLKPGKSCTHKLKVLVFF